MRSYIIPLLVLLASCGTTHKIVTSKKTTSDSSSLVIKDSSHVSKESSISDNLNVQNVHIRVEYAADTALAKAKEQRADTVGWKPYYPGKKATGPAAEITQAIRDAIAAGGGNGRLPSSITVDIGSISDSSIKTTKSDSGTSHSSDAKALNKTENDNSKKVDHTGLPLGLKISIGIFLFILLLVAAWKLYQKFKPV